MGTEAILKDVFEVYCRLFDHRPALKSEVSFFIREFEDKRKNQEVMHLQRTLEYCREINENLISCCVEQLNCNLPILNDSLNDAIKTSHRIASHESDTSMTEWLSAQGSERAKDWDRYLSEMSDMASLIDKEFDDEVRRVENYYEELYKCQSSVGQLQ